MEERAEKPDRSAEAGAAVLVVGVAAQLFLGQPHGNDAMNALMNGCCGGPFYFAAFVLGIIAMSRGRVAGGLLLLVAAVAAPIVAAGFAIAFSV